MKAENIIYIVLIAIAAIFLLNSLFSLGSGGNYQGYGMMGPGYNMMGFYPGGMFLFGWLIMSLFIIALILGIVWLLKQLQHEERRKR
ncbi:MAG TPA: hypothetical protein VJJ21_01815 [Candidatus Nanoarchaeia archaeon]|nr:hypothetical protein [Candidatus Nanoarchaeia archaeon]